MANELGTLMGQVILDVNDAMRSYDKIRNQHQGLITSASQISSTMGEVGRGFLGVGTVIVGALGASIGMAAEFEKKMNFFQAVTGTSGEAMEGLQSSVIKWAEDSLYNMSEVADAMIELGKAGANVDTIMGGLGEAVVTLGQAADIDLGASAQIMVATMTQFKLGAEDAIHIANRLQGASNASIIDMTDLGVTMKYVGGIASSLGVNLDDTTTAVALLGQAGIKGSMAGTSLRQILVSLAGNTKPAQAALSKLGIITADGSNKFYDMAGNLKPLPEVFQLLSDSMNAAGYTAKEKLSAFRAIFNNRALGAADALTTAGAAGFAEMNGEIEKVDAADVAAGRIKGLAGAIEMFTGNLETFMAQTGKPFLDTLAYIVRGATAVLQAFNSLPEGVRVTIVWIIAIIGVLLTVAGTMLIVGSALVNGYQNFLILKNALPALAKSLKALRTAMLAFNMALLTSPVFWIIIAIIALIVVIVLLWKKSETFRNIVKKVWEEVKQAIGATVDWITGTAWPAIRSFMFKVVAIFKRAIGFIRDNWRLIIGFLLGPFGLIIAGVTKYWSQIKAIFFATLKTIAGLVSLYFNTMKNIIVGVFNAIKAFTMAVWNSIVAYYTFVWNTIVTVVTTYINTVRNIITAVWNFIVSITTTIWNSVVSAVTSAVQGIWSVITGLYGSIMGFFAGVGEWLYNVGKDLIQGLINGIQDMVGNAVGAVKDLAGSVIGGIGGALGINSPSVIMHEMGRYLDEGLAQGITSGAGMPIRSLRELADALIETPMTANLGSLGLSPSLSKVPSTGQYAMANASGSKETNIKVEVNNPVPEKASTSLLRTAQKTAYLGFGDDDDE